MMSGEALVGINVELVPAKVWEFFNKNKKRLSEEMVLIAENINTGYAIYVTDEDGYPRFYVYSNDVNVGSEAAISEADCQITVKNLYLKYLIPFSVVSGAKKTKDVPRSECDEEYQIPDEADDYKASLEQEEEPLTRQDMFDEIEEREEEIRSAFLDFMEVVLMDQKDLLTDPVFSGEAEDILEHLLAYIAVESGFPVYRPTFVDGDDGVETLVDYPYGDLTREDIETMFGGK